MFKINNNIMKIRKIKINNFNNLIVRIYIKKSILNNPENNKIIDNLKEINISNYQKNNNINNIMKKRKKKRRKKRTRTWTKRMRKNRRIRKKMQSMNKMSQNINIPNIIKKIKYNKNNNNLICLIKITLGQLNNKNQISTWPKRMDIKLLVHKEFKILNSKILFKISHKKYTHKIRLILKIIKIKAVIK